MNILLIWDGIEFDGAPKPVPARVMENYIQIKELYPEVKITWITMDEKSVPGGDTYIDWFDYVKKAWDDYYFPCDETETIPSTDFFRYMYLAEVPHTLYLDTDMYLKDRIPEIDGMMKWNNDVSAIWNGKETGFFKYILKYRGSNIVRKMHRFFPRQIKFLNEYMDHNSIRA